MRAKTINEIQYFERTGNPLNKLDIGINAIVYSFLKWIKSQDVFKTNTENYSGFLEIGIDDINDKDLQKGFIKFVETWPRYKQKMDNLGLDIEDGRPGAIPTLEKTMFTDEYLPEPNYYS